MCECVNGRLEPVFYLAKPVAPCHLLEWSISGAARKEWCCDEVTVWQGQFFARSSIQLEPAEERAVIVELKT